MRIAFTLAAALLAATSATAQVATADLQGAVDQSAAMTAARQQIQTTYKTQLDAANARQTALQAQLAPLATEIRTLQANPATPPATLQAKIATAQQRQQAAERELQTLTASFQRPAAYAQEQIAAKLEPAVRAAMQAKNVSLLVRPDAVLIAQPAGDITADVVAQLNNQVKTVSITPPAGWQPGQRPTGAPAPAGQGR